MADFIVDSISLFTCAIMIDWIQIKSSWIVTYQAIVCYVEIILVNCEAAKHISTTIINSFPWETWEAYWSITMRALEIAFLTKIIDFVIANDARMARQRRAADQTIRKA